MREIRWIAGAALVAIATAGCSSGAAPGWTFPPTAAAGAAASTAPAARRDHHRCGRGHADDHGLRPRLQARVADRARGRPVCGQARQHRLHRPRRHVPRRYEDRRRGRRDRDGRGRRPGGRPLVPVLHPRARGGRDAGRDHRRRRDGRLDGRRHARHGPRRRGPGRRRDHAGVGPGRRPERPCLRPPRPAGAAALPGKVHDIDLPIIETNITVAEGFVVHAWTFGGTVPGPTIRVHLGDTVNVHLTNRGSMSHSIDFHASQTAMNHQMIEIKPGESFTYTFTADYAGVWMYHCGTAPALHHIANGMFGMVIVEPKGGLPKVDDEFAFVQSEWYLGPRANRPTTRRPTRRPPRPTSSCSTASRTSTRTTRSRSRPRGGSGSSSSTPGPRSTAPSTSSGRSSTTSSRRASASSAATQADWGSQAVDLAPAQGAIIEFTPVEDGMYPLRHPRVQPRHPRRDRDLLRRRWRPDELTATR